MGLQTDGTHHCGLWGYSPLYSCRKGNHWLKLMIIAISGFWGYSFLQSFKGTVSRDFCYWFFSEISFPPAPEYPIRTVSNFCENSRRYSQVKVHHWRHQWQNCNLPPVSTCTTPAENLPPVANNRNNIRLLRP